MCLAAFGIANASWTGLIATGLFLALFWQQSGMLMHDYMHSQVSFSIGFFVTAFRLVYYTK